MSRIRFDLSSEPTTASIGTNSGDLYYDVDDRVFKFKHGHTGSKVSLFGGLPADDTSIIVQNITDGTKKMRFDASAISSGQTRVLTIPNKDGTLAMTDDIVIDATAIHTDGVGEFAGVTSKVSPISADILLIEDSENGNVKKRITIGALPDTVPFADTLAIVKGSVDVTKRIRFEVDGLTTATTRVYTAPDKDGTLAMLDDIPGAVNLFSQIDVSGQNSVVADSPTDNLTLAAGAGISITTNDVTDTITVTNVAPSDVTSVFSRTGAVVAATNDYTWAQIDKTTSSLADLTTRASTNLSDTAQLVRNNAANTWSTGIQDFRTASMRIPRTVSAPFGEDYLYHDTTDDRLYFNFTSGSDAMVTRDATQTLTNKTLSSDSIMDNVVFKNQAAPTKVARFEVGSISLATTRTFTLPDKDGTVAMMSDIAAAANTFLQIDVAGQNSVVADSPTDNLTLIAGTGITITTDDVADSITITGVAAGDANAIHVNVANEINGIALKNNPSDADIMVIEDNDDLFNKKRITAGSLTSALFPLNHTTAIVKGAVPSKRMRFDADTISPGTTRTLTIQDADGTIAYLSDIPTVPTSHTQLTDIGTNTHAVLDQKVADLDAHVIAEAAHGTVGAVVGTTDAQTITQKTLIDNSVKFADAADNTKKLAFQLAALPTLTERTLQMPSADGTIAIVANIPTSHTQLADIGSTTHAQLDTHVAAATAHGVTGSIVGTDGAQTLTSKTLTTGNIIQHDTKIRSATSDRDAKFNCDSISASTTRTFTFPDKNGTIATLSDVVDGSKGVTIFEPVDNDVFKMFYTREAITINYVYAAIAGGTSVSGLQIKHDPALNAAGTNVFTSSQTVNNAAGQSLTGFSGASVPANSWVWITYTTVSGAVTTLGIDVFYTRP